MRAVSVYSLRDNLARHLDAVVKTESPIVVSRFGKPIAIITPYKSSLVRSIDEYFGFLGKGETGERFLRRIRRSLKEKRAIALRRKGA